MSRRCAGIWPRLAARVDDILAMFAAILRIAEVESGARKAAFDSVDLGEVVDTVVEVYRSSAEEKRQRLEHRIDPDVRTTGDRDLLVQLFANLVENAIRHCPPGACIEVLVLHREGGIEVSVSDDGPGIPVNMRDKVLQRFVRLENSRTSPGLWPRAQSCDGDCRPARRASFYHG